MVKLPHTQQVLTPVHPPQSSPTSLHCPGRFWGQNKGVFTERQCEALSHISLSRTVCDNPGITTDPRDIFRASSAPGLCALLLHPQPEHICLQRQMRPPQVRGPSPTAWAGSGLHICSWTGQLSPFRPLSRKHRTHLEGQDMLSQWLPSMLASGLIATPRAQGFGGQLGSIHLASARSSTP